LKEFLLKKGCPKIFLSGRALLVELDEKKVFCYFILDLN